uniref:Uncharacterized protein n=1 Tax=Arundo donax TaxID=35708 RepID=A0A0A8Y7X1_ARUDO
MSSFYNIKLSLGHTCPPVFYILVTT